MAWLSDSTDQRTRTPEDGKKEARRILRWSSLFVGEVRDGLTMINMQNAFLVVSKGYTEKQSGILYFVFGISQFLFQGPAGYLFDYSENKATWFSIAAASTTGLTLVTAAFAKPQGKNLTLMVIVKILQGAATAFIPPGFNSITQGIVGMNGMTQQVASTEMMNHLGTVFIALTSAILAMVLYPELGLLFLVSPVACAGLFFFICRLDPSCIDHNEARGLTSIQQTASNTCGASAIIEHNAIENTSLLLQHEKGVSMAKVYWRAPTAT
ncbi:hypothetical protein ACA910_004341 [Epithemia clementina (nom. ined.)]